jgi:V/A-type H+-transporting ATPase subunit E
MAYENLLKSVEENAEEREREIRRKAERDAADIREGAKREAEEIQAQAIRESERSAAIERNKQLFLAKSAIREASLVSREQVFEAAFDEAGKRLGQIRQDRNYPEIFARLVREAIGGMGNAPFRVHVDKRDAALCSATLAALGVQCEVVPDIECAGGLVVSSPDGLVTIANTVESRLERVKEHRRREIYAILAGG